MPPEDVPRTVEKKDDAENPAMLRTRMLKKKTMLRMKKADVDGLMADETLEEELPEARGDEGDEEAGAAAKSVLNSSYQCPQSSSRFMSRFEEHVGKSGLV
jgi:hypothetical protein